MTRDEHLARADELLGYARAVYEDTSWETNPRASYASDADYRDALHLASEMHAVSLAEVQALAEWSQAHTRLAEALGQQPTAEGTAPLWVRKSRNRYERDRGVWALEYRSPLVDDDPDAGWYLFGPGLSEHGYWTCQGLAAAQAMANQVIDHANPRAAEADA